MSQGVAYPLEQVAQALRDSSGMIAVAARRLGIPRSALYRRIQNTPTLQEVLKNERELMTDTAELALKSAIIAKEGWAVCFYLKTQGRERGYVERYEITIKQAAEKLASEMGIDASELIAEAERIVASVG